MGVPKNRNYSPVITRKKIGKKNIIISAFSFYPDVESSEGIVNRNWFEIISQSENYNLCVISAKRILCDAKKKPDRILTFLFEISGNKKKYILGVFYKAFNKVLLQLKILKFPLYHFIWFKMQKRSLALKLKEIDKDQTLIWIRILPGFPIKPILELWAKINFPLILNINDPINIKDLSKNKTSAYTDSSQEYNLLAKTKDIAQCWTFPTYQLAKKISDKYNFEIDRCFVIPHAMHQQKNLYVRNVNTGNNLKIIYTGTFYKSAFSDAFGRELKKFNEINNFNDVEFIFVLSQYSQDAFNWLKKFIPKATIYTKLKRKDVLNMLSQVDCVLIPESEDHQDLLKGKLTEAISLGIPIFAVTYPNSVLNNIVEEYGGISSFANRQDNISTALRDLTFKLNNKTWLDEFYKKRDQVIGKFSETQIRNLTFQVAEFAFERHLWSQGKRNLKPEPPSLPQWP